MANATNAQIQNFSDTQVRPICEEMRDIEIKLTACLGQIGDIYSALNVPSPTWTDTRTDGPPHLAQPSDILAMNTMFTQVLAAITGNGQYPIMLELCVRTP